MKDRKAETRRRIRIVLGKPGLDGHTRGLELLSSALRDAGMEVIYAGVGLTPEELVSTAVQENADILGISTHAGGARVLMEKILRLLEEKGVRGLPTIIGGIIPPKDFPKLKEMGAKGIFGPGTPVQEIIDTIKSSIAHLQE
jgi:methylmalonyl-CoA mutase C-terminal domain/subunit